MERQFYARMENAPEPIDYTQRTYSSIDAIIFNLLALPLSIVYFTLITVGLSLGIGTVVLWIGLPITVATLWLIRGMGSIERQMIRSLLHIPLPEPVHNYYEYAPKRGFIKQASEVLHAPVTWTSLIYMLLKLPLSIIAFTISIAFSATAVALTLTPLAYLIAVFLGQQGIIPGDVHLQIMLTSGHSFIEAHNYFEPLMLMRSFMLLPLGLLMGWLTRWLLAKMAYISGALARALLCFNNNTTAPMSSPKD